MKQLLKDFTFLELILGVALLGGIAASVVPDQVAAADESRELALWRSSGVVKDAHSALISATHHLPSVAGLAAQMHGVQAQPGGVLVTVNGDRYTVPTYRNGLCTEPTRSVDDSVGCVGAIAS